MSAGFLGGMMNPCKAWSAAGFSKGGTQTSPEIFILRGGHYFYFFKMGTLREYRHLPSGLHIGTT